MDLVGHFGSFLLDSGAYTFMAGSHKGAIDWDEYVESYAKFENGICKCFGRECRMTSLPKFCFTMPKVVSS